MEVDLPVTQNKAGYPTPATDVDVPAQVDSSDAQQGECLRRLGSGIKELIAVVDGLHQIGVSQLIDHLPQIVVCGDQSSGKSSLIEGLSLVKVPRSEGKCTSCPLYITLLNTGNDGPQWICKVSLEHQYVYDRSATGSGELGPWVHQVKETKLFKEVETHQDLEKVLFCAQKSLLNPGKNFDEFINLSRTLDYHGPGRAETDLEENEVKFSPNTIRVEVRTRFW
jgi:hypothetical protein